MQILRQSLKLLRFTQLFDNVNPFTEAVVGDWDLPDEVHFVASYCGSDTTWCICIAHLQWGRGSDILCLCARRSAIIR